jgi:hypothetical protein
MVEEQGVRVPKFLNILKMLQGATDVKRITARHMAQGLKALGKGQPFVMQCCAPCT